MYIRRIHRVLLLHERVLWLLLLMRVILVL